MKSSLWFLPTLCVLIAAGLAAGLVELDSRLTLQLEQSWPRFFGLGADGSRSILATIAQSVITIAGVSFSITIVALSLAANQYTPRVLRNFMRDTGNQAVLGGLAGIFTYCIIVLRTVHSGEQPFVPALSTMMALVFAIVAVGLFIYFIHHVATAIQVSTILSSIADETRESILTLFPEEVGQDSRECELTSEEEAVLAHTAWKPVPAERAGYLQSMSQDSLVALARKQEAVINMECAIGDFVIEGKPLVWFAPAQKLDERIVRRLNRLISLAPYRTIDQDPAYGIRQIVDVAVKALSPGINDPTTAVTCLDHLASVFSLLVLRRIPPRCRYEDRQLRLVTRRPSFEFLLNLAFNEIRQHGGGQPAVILGLFRAIEQIAKTRSLIPERKALLECHAGLALSMAEQSIRFPPDLDEVRAHAGKLAAWFRESAGQPRPDIEGSSPA